MVLYLFVLIVFSLHRESLKLILVDEPLPEVILSELVSKWFYDTSTGAAVGAAAVVLLLEMAFLVSWSSALVEHGEHEDLCGSGCRSVIPNVHGENGVVLLKPGLARVSLSLFSSDPLEVVSTRAFYSSRSGSYSESEGLTSGLRGGKTLCCRAPLARSSK
jgi:hypothetical protein